MVLPPAVVIHGSSDRDATLAAARTAGRPVLLLSAPGAAAFGGAGWWRALTEGADSALDCGDEAGRALEALAAGCSRLILHPCPAWNSVAARALPGQVLAIRPVALDLGRTGAARHLPAWLRGDSVPGIG